MLSSPKLTVYDVCAFFVLAALLVRVLGDGAATGRIATQPAMENIRAMSVPHVREARGMDLRVRGEVSMRCAGLHQALGSLRCQRCQTSMDRRVRRRIHDYARAYQQLAQDEHESSQLILRRDSATCNRYPEFREAGLHEQQERQSRRSL